jgi:sugar lactone lactonase YvrE
MPLHITPTVLRRTLSAAGLVLAAFASAHAQAPALVPIPIVTTYAGLAAGSGNVACTGDLPNNAGVHLGDGCLPTQATLASVYGSFTDAVGNIYISENGTDNDVRVIYKGGSVLAALLVASNANLTNFTPIPGRIYTLAGGIPSTLTVKNGSKFACNAQTTGPVGLDSAGDGCPGAQSYVKPRGLSVDANGNVFMVSTGGGNTVKVLYAGGAQVANLITLENPGVTPQFGYMYKLAGQSTAAYSGDGGLASAAAIVVVRDIVVDPSGNLFISDGTTTSVVATKTVILAANNIRRIDGKTGIITTYAGETSCVYNTTNGCPYGFSGDGGPATSALLQTPYTLFLDRFNNLYISEYYNNRLRVVYAGGTIAGISNPVVGNIYTYAGGGSSTGNGTAANQLSLGSVQVSGIDPSGNIYVEDATSKAIWRFDATTGVGYIVAGRSGTAPTNGVNCGGAGATGGPVSLDNFGDGCPAVQAAFGDIGRISFDPQGNFYVGENGNGIVRRLSYNTQFPNTTVAASSTQPIAYEALSPLTLTNESFSLQGASSTEFSDAGNGTCTATSVLTASQLCVFNVAFTPAHDGLRPGALQLSSTVNNLTADLSGIGVGADLAVDPATKTSVGTNLTPSGVVTDVRGNLFVADRTGNQVLKGTTTGTTLTPVVTGLNKPAGLAIDSLGNIYIADTGNNRVLETTSTGTTITTFGTGLSVPQGVAVDAFGNVFIADTGNNRVLEVTPSGVQSVAPLTGLSAPTQLTFDYSGNLFVVDSGNSRIVELPVNGNQTAIALPGVTPTTVAVDPSGTLYTTDSTSLQLLAFAPGSTTGTPVLNGLNKPAGLAVDSDGNLFLADSGLSTLTVLSRSLATVSFPITNVNQSSTASLNLSNVGNAALSFPSANLANITGSPQFTLASATTNGCATGVSYAPGTGCNLTATFAPTIKGQATANATFNTNAGNAASALLSGNGQQLVTTSATLAVTSPIGAIVYGQTVVLSASVTPSSNAGAPTGTVTFTVDGRAQTPQAYGTGAYTLSLPTTTVGTHTVSIAFSGDSLYASSSANTSFTVAKATTTTALAIVPLNANGAISLVFTATVASATATGETGSVTFYAGTQALTTMTLNSASRTAVYTTPILGFTTNTFTAVYTGDSNFNGSTSSTIAGAADFAIGSSAPTVSIPQGGVATVSFVIDSLYGSSGTIIPSCSGLPANSICRFQPTTITLNGNVAVALEIYTNVNPSLASNDGFSRNQLFLAGLLPLSLGLLAFSRHSRRLPTLLCFAFLLALVPITGCGNGSTAANASQGLVTPVGSSNVTVTFTGAAPLATHSTTFTFTVLVNNTGF